MTTDERYNHSVAMQNVNVALKNMIIRTLLASQDISAIFLSILALTIREV